MLFVSCHASEKCRQTVGCPVAHCHTILTSIGRAHSNRLFAHFSLTLSQTAAFLAKGEYNEMNDVLLEMNRLPTNRPSEKRDGRDAISTWSEDWQAQRIGCCSIVHYSPVVRPEEDRELLVKIINFTAALQCLSVSAHCSTFSHPSPLSPVSPALTQYTQTHSFFSPKLNSVLLLQSVFHVFITCHL